MGRARRPHPKYLPAKLREIRRRLALTQQQLLERLSRMQPSLRVGHISEFESGKRKPSLGVLLAYARLAELPLELLADDELQMPERLPRHVAQTVSRGGCATSQAAVP